MMDLVNTNSIKQPMRGYNKQYDVVQANLK